MGRRDRRRCLDGSHERQVRSPEPDRQAGGQERILLQLPWAAHPLDRPSHVHDRAAGSRAATAYGSQLAASLAGRGWTSAHAGHRQGHGLMGDRDSPLITVRSGTLMASEDDLSRVERALDDPRAGAGHAAPNSPSRTPLAKGRRWKVSGSSEGGRRGDQLRAPMAGETGWLLCPGPRTAGRGSY
jgi:hypothetical protein